MGLFWRRYLFFIGCYEAVQETGSIFVPPNSPMSQFDTTVTQSLAYPQNGSYKKRQEKEERSAGSKGEGKKMAEKEACREKKIGKNKHRRKEKRSVGMERRQGMSRGWKEWMGRRKVGGRKRKEK